MEMSLTFAEEEQKVTYTSDQNTYNRFNLKWEIFEGTNELGD